MPRWKKDEGTWEFVDGETLIGWVYNGDTGSTQHPPWCARMSKAFADPERGTSVHPQWRLRDAKQAVEARHRKFLAAQSLTPTP